MIGIILAIVGILILLILFASSRSVITGAVINLLTGLIGWGAYILPVVLITFGLWLILRKIERIPPLSLERAVGSILLFTWLLTTIHTLRAAQDAVGGGYIGRVFENILWVSLGPLGLAVVLIAWLLIALTMILDVTVQDLFRWMGPLTTSVKALAVRIVRKRIPAPSGVGSEAQTNGYTPLKQDPASIPATSSLPLSKPNLPTVTTTSSAPAIQWVLPETTNILDEGSAPAENEEFINQRAKLIQETLASFGAPAQVVEISRGPTITQFGVEPLFVETRAGRTRVRVSKIASLADDLALALAAPRIRIQAPVP